MKKDDGLQNLTAALGHPVRRLILRKAISKGTPTSPKELSRELTRPLPNVSYHVRILAERGALKLVALRPGKGSTQHFYEPCPKFLAQPPVQAMLQEDAAS